MNKVELELQLRTSHSLAEYFTLSGSSRGVWLEYNQEGGETRKIAYLEERDVKDLQKLTTLCLEHMAKFREIKELTRENKP